MNCKICSNSTSLFGTGKLLNKYSAAFHRCGQCGFIQSENPYWLDESYSTAITKSDIGMLGRNLQIADITKRLLLMCFPVTGKFIDYGGGYGIFVRLMRDQGFDFYRHDPLCENIFAEGFEAYADEAYDLLTAWEVFEHLVDPLAEIEKMLNYSENIFFSTILLPHSPKPLDQWWYYGLEHGQHVSFYTRETLRVISKKHNLKLHHSSSSVHLLGRKQIHPVKTRIIFGRRLGLFRSILSQRAPQSLLEKDFHQITGRFLNEPKPPGARKG